MKRATHNYSAKGATRQKWCDLNDTTRMARQEWCNTTNATRAVWQERCDKRDTTRVAWQERHNKSNVKIRTWKEWSCSARRTTRELPHKKNSMRRQQHTKNNNVKGTTTRKERQCDRNNTQWVATQEKEQREEQHQRSSVRSKAKRTWEKKLISNKCNTKQEWHLTKKQKMKHELHFYTHSLSLTLNDASASIGEGDCLGTLNYQESDASFLKEPVQFFKIKTKKTNSHNWFSFM
jgi:hypothetical protein